MNNNGYVNHCIACDVTACKNHHRTQSFCSLESIKVGTHEKDPTVPPCTDCQSFEAMPQTQMQN
ncbi:MAG: DUF1540 domain-containing protein [Ruminococcus sp.]|nr:DUF1540 domain-containing protein [Ruminococcus sp.]